MKLKLGGHIITVKEASDKDLSHNYAQWQARTNTVTVNKEIDKSQKQSAILHEVLHAIFFNSGLYCYFKQNQEEQIVRHIEPLLYAFIKDNPKWIRELLK